MDGQRAVHALDAVLQEERHLNARVLEEAAQVLLEHVEVGGAHAAEVLGRELDGLVHEALDVGRLDEVLGVGQVVHGHLQQLVGGRAGQHLVLEAHAHEVVELRQHQETRIGQGERLQTHPEQGRGHLVHAVGVEPHDG